jgi:nitroimidazol reductase NimA-like FMN-containing flavoprotein (pyridoxamine 5'-phosphate oxidase superfamily)
MRKKEREVNDIESIELIISNSDVCRIAFADNNMPYIVTMNFGYSGGDNPCLYFHCANEGRKLDMIKKNNHVCFQMDTDHEVYGGDTGCDWGMKFSSVVGYGNISVVVDQRSRKAGLDCLMRHYAGDRDFTYDENVLARTTILRLDITEMTGKKR